jgi:16S rRNA (guanine966-N2)-methyltransferase
MRIIAGAYKGHKISTFGGGYRPTSAIIKKSLFDIIAAEIEGSRFLDMFAGSGAVGLEALSRGAEYVCFIENSKSHVNVLRENVERLEIDKGSYEILPMDYAYALQSLMERRETFDIIFVDPPYSAIMPGRILGEVVESRVLAPDGILVLEGARVDSRKTLDAMPRELYPVREQDHGGTALIFFRWHNAAAEKDSGDESKSWS